MEVRFNIWTEVNGEVALSVWRVALLEAVRETGSISAAAERQGVHFRVAWKKLKEMEERLGLRLVIGQVGGSGGGGATLTPEAETLIRRFRAFSSGLDSQLQDRYAQYFNGLLPSNPGD